MTQRARLLRRTFLVALALCVGGMLALTAYTLWRLRVDAVDSGLENAAMHTRGVEDFLTQSLHVIELVAANALMHEAHAPDPRDVESTFVTILRHAPFLRSMSLLDERGRVVASSNPANVGIVVPTQGYLPATTGTLEILRIGQPWVGRDFAGGRPATAQAPVDIEAPSFIPMTRTLTAGERSVTLLVALNPDYFINHIAQQIDAAEGSVEVLRYDGTLLMSTDPGEHPGSLHDYVVRDLRLAEVESGTFEQDFGNGRNALTAFRASRLYPLVVVTHINREHALRYWLTEAKTLLGVIIPVLLTITLLAIVFYRRQMQLVAQRAEAERLQQINATVFGSSAEAIIITDLDANIISVNAAFTRITGYGAEEALGRNPRLVASGRQDKSFYEHMWRCILEEGVWRGELVNRRKDGSLYDAQATITAFRDGEGRLRHFIGVTTDITERKQAGQALVESESRFREIFDTVGDAILIHDVETGALIDVNRRMCEMYGFTHEEALACGPDDLSAGTPPYSSAEAAEKLHLARIRGVQTFDWQARARDGHLFWVEVSLRFALIGSQQRVVAAVRDITERKQVEEKLQLAASVFTHAREGIMITAADGTIIDVNDTFSRITGYERDQVLGRNPRLLNSGRQKKKFYATMWHELIGNGYWYGEVWNRRKNGEVYAEMLTISAVRDALGNTQQYVALFSDITPLKEHQQQLEHIAHYDALTMLPNRVLLADRLRQAMAQAQRRGQRLAVAYLDLDGFKVINDHHGHEAGDQLLMTLAARMKQALREGDTLARLGGDEFVAVLIDLADVAASVPMLTRLLAAAAQPVQFGDLFLHVSASVGVTFYPRAKAGDDDVDADQLLRQADQAMYQAKLAGKNRYHVFDAEQDRSVRGHHESLEHIRRALTEREFVLHYQPKVNMRRGTVIGAEALIRWQHPEGGLLPPAVFLPVIEDHPLAVELGEWVIDTALSQMEVWQAAGLDIPVSVNVGARQLQQADFVGRLCGILAAHPDVRPGDLELEVLETSALEDLAQVSQLIEDCREIGVMFALDDFGTGYSSLTYLKRLSVAVLKIDQSFVHDMLDDPDDLAILEGVLGLATAFRRQVIAEGVETVEHGEMLLQLGCELAQGYGIARPMPAHELPGWSAAWVPDSRWVDLAAVSRDDLPLLFAVVEHRAWIAAMENHLRGEREVPPPLDPRQCRLGTWLDAGGLAARGDRHSFAAIDALHRQVHALAAELCELRVCGRNPEALARLGELHGRRDALVEQLQELVGESRQQAEWDGR